MSRLSSLVLLLSVIFTTVLGTIPELPRSNRVTFPADLEGFTLVEFYKPKNKKSKSFATIMRRLVRYVAVHEEDFMGLKFEQFNCKGGHSCKKLKIKSLPTLRLYLDNRKIAELRRCTKPQKVLSWLKKHLNRHRQSYVPPVSSESSESESESSSEDVVDPEPTATTTQNQETVVPTTVTPISTTNSIATPAKKMDHSEPVQGVKIVVAAE